MKKLLVSLLVLGTTALYFGQTATTAVFTDLVDFTGNGSNNLFQTNAISPPGAATPILTSSVAGSTVITTSGAHMISTGDTVVIAGHTGSTPSVNGTYTATYVTSASFSIPLTVTVGGTGGTATRPITAAVQAANGGTTTITSAPTSSTFATGHRIYSSPATPTKSISASSGGSVTSISSSSNASTTTITTSGVHGLVTGATVVIAGHSIGTVNGTWVITFVTTTSFTIPAASTGGGATGTVTPQATITTGSAHRLQVGDTVVVSGYTGSTPAIGGRYTVSTVASSTSFAIPVAMTVAGTGGLAHRTDPIVSIVSSSVASPSTITTAQAHGLTTGDIVWVSGHSGSTPALSGAYYTATVVTTTTFTIPINVTVGGTGGQLYKAALRTTILSSSVANPTTITTAAPHGLTTGDKVRISGHTGSTPAIANTTDYSVTVVTSTTFTIAVNVTVAGTGGSIVRAQSSYITSTSVASATVVTTGAPHGLVTGETVFITGHTGSTPAVFGSYTATVTSGTTFTVPVNVTVAGTGGQFYRVGGVDVVASSGTATITSSSAANPTTITTPAAHNLQTGNTVVISGHSVAGVNNTWAVTVTGANTFTVPVVSTGGTGGTWSAPSGTVIISTAMEHRFVAGDQIYMGNLLNSSPPIEGQYSVLAVPNTKTFTLSVSATVGGAGGTVKGPWSQVGANLPNAYFSANDTPADQGVYFYTVRGYYDASSSIWESPNSNIVGSGIMNDLNVVVPNPRSWAISSETVANPTVVTTSTAHGLTTGDKVTIHDVGGSIAPAAFNGQYTATVLSSTTFSVPVNVTVAGTGGTVDEGLTAAITSSTAATPTVITTAAAHGLAVGDTVTIYSHTSTPNINQQWVVQTVPSGTTFTIATTVSVAGGATGRVGLVGLTAGQGYAVTATARLADGATLVPFTGAVTLSRGNATANIVSSSVANPSTITTSTPHNLATGDTITISGHSGSTPSINNTYTVTAVTATTFTIPVNVTVGGTGGSETKLPAVTCTGSCSQSAVAGVASYTATFPDAQSNGGNPVTIRTRLHAASNSAPSRAGDSVVFYVSPNDFLVHPGVTVITSSSVANPSTITTSSAHGLTTGDSVSIFLHSGSTPALSGPYSVTVVTTTTFTIPLNVTVGGTGGYVVPANGNQVSGQNFTLKVIARDAAAANMTSTPPSLFSGDVTVAARSDGGRTGTLKDGAGAACPCTLTAVNGVATFTLKYSDAPQTAGVRATYTVGPNNTQGDTIDFSVGPSTFLIDNGSGSPITSSGVRTTVATSAVSVANPTVITTATHGYANGDTVLIAGTNTTPTVNGTWVISEVTATTFKIQVNVTSVTSAVGTATRGSLITTPAVHGLTTGDQVKIVNHSGSTPALAGPYTATVASTTTFFVPVAVTVGGAGGYSIKYQTATVPYTIRATAQDSAAATVTWYTGNVVLTESGSSNLKCDGSSGGCTKAAVAGVATWTGGAGTGITQIEAGDANQTGITLSANDSGFTPTGKQVTIASSSFDVTKVPIAVNSVSTCGATCTVGTTSATRAWTQTITANNDSMLVVGVTWKDGASETVLRVCWQGAGTSGCPNGQSLTSRGVATNGTLVKTEMWTLTNPAVAAGGTITVTWSAAVRGMAGAIALTGVDTANPFDGVVSTTTGKAPMSFTISGNTAANPTVITTSVNNALATGDTVTITGSNSTPSINGTYTATVTAANKFTIPVTVTGAGTTGTVTSGSTPSVTTTVGAFKSLVLDAVGVQLSPVTWTVGTGQTSHYSGITTNGTAANNVRGAGSREAAASAGAAVTMTETWTEVVNNATARTWAYVVQSFKPKGDP